jgi:signal peptidase I
MNYTEGVSKFQPRGKFMVIQRKHAILISLLAVMALVGLAGPIVLRLFFFNYSRIPQNGMYPGIPAGRLFVSKKRPYRNVSEVMRGDVVVFTRDVGGSTYRYIWRVVGLPGDLVEVSNEAVSLDGHPLKHETVRKEGQYLIVREWNGDVSYEVAYNQTLDRAEPPPIASMKVPGDHLFLLGDNRYMAEDSTFIGPVPFSSIVEKKIF